MSSVSELLPSIRTFLGISSQYYALVKETDTDRLSVSGGPNTEFYIDCVEYNWSWPARAKAGEYAGGIVVGTPVPETADTVIVVAKHHGKHWDSHMGGRDALDTYEARRCDREEAADVINELQNDDTPRWVRATNLIVSNFAFNGEL